MKKALEITIAVICVALLVIATVLFLKTAYQIGRADGIEEADAAWTAMLGEHLAQQQEPVQEKQVVEIDPIIIRPPVVDLQIPSGDELHEPEIAIFPENKQSTEVLIDGNYCNSAEICKETEEESEESEDVSYVSAETQEPNLVLLDTFIATAYCDYGTTATGTTTTEGRTIAVNPDDIPYGTHIWLYLDDGTFVGDYYAEDTGGNLLRQHYGLRGYRCLTRPI